MQVRIFILALILFYGVSFIPSTAQTGRESQNAPSEEDILKVNEYLEEGLVLMRQGKFEEALEVLEKGEEMNIEPLVFSYEIAHANYQLGNYKEAIDRLAVLKDNPNAVEQIYQLLGNSFRHLKQFENAKKAYREGLQKFPRSGRLYMELGITEYALENAKQAADYWEFGIEAEPSFAKNYYHLAQFYADTPEKLWTVIYGEICINLTADDERLLEMKRLVLNTYKNSLMDAKDGRADFTAIMIKTKNKKDRMPFAMAFEEIMTLAAKNTLPDDKEDFSADTLESIRRQFIERWYSEGYAEKFSNSLFDYHKRLIDSGYFHEYHKMIFADYKSPEYKKWTKNSAEKIKEYIEWLNVNRYIPDYESYVSKRHYE